MKRNVLCLLLALCLALSPLAVRAAAGASFYDLPPENWAYAYVQTLAAEGIVSGYPDGSFQPDRPVTRAEFAKLLAFTAGIDTPITYEMSYSDVPMSHWAYRYVEAAKYCLPGYGQGAAAVFQPSEGALREDIAYALVRALDLNPADADTSVLSRFTDLNSISAAVQPYMALAVTQGFFGGYPDGTIRARGTITRAEAAAVLVRTFRGGQTVSPEPVPTEAQAGPEEPIATETPAPTRTPEPDVPDAPAEARLEVGGQTYALGMTEEQLTARAGAPAETVSSMFGYNCLIFDSEDYSGGFFMAGVWLGKLVMLCSAGDSFRYQGCSAGAANLPGGNAYGSYLTDKNDGDALHAVALLDPYYALGSDTSGQALYGESRVIFHLTNAFRVYHGLSPLGWSSPASDAARLHSQDMADKNYFQHVSPDGRTPSDRLKAQGVTDYTTAGENITGGYGSLLVSGGIGAYNSWVNSSGHRGNLLGSFTSLGVGCGYNAGGLYRFYATQVFFAG